MPCQLLSTSLSEAESEARRFYDRWIGGAGLLSILGRLIFRMSGIVYSGTFIRAARLTPDQRILEIGCGMGTILTATQRRLCSNATYLGVDLSLQMVIQGRLGVLDNRDQNPVSLVVGSGLSLPVSDSLFDVVLLSHVIKYLTDEDLSQVLREAKEGSEAGREDCPLGIPSGFELICHTADSPMLQGSKTSRSDRAERGDRSSPF